MNIRIKPDPIRTPINVLYFIVLDERQVHGYYKWDTKPDITIVNAPYIEKQFSNQTDMSRSDQENISDERNWLKITWENFKINASNKLSKLLPIPYNN